MASQPTEKDGGDGGPRHSRRLAVDLTPLRESRDFRLLWLGELVSTTGTQVTLVAVFIQVYDLTGSSAAVGLVGLAQLLVMVVVTVFGGPLIDRFDRRRLLLFAQVGQAATTLLLLAGAIAGDPPLLLVYTAAGVAAGLGGFGLSARSAIVPNVVRPPMLSTALALNQVMWNTCLLVGPAVGGLLVGRVGLSWAYGIDAISFAIGLLFFIALSPSRPKDVTAPDGAKAIWEGVRYLKGRRVLQSTFTADLVAMIFGMPRALFPVLAMTQFDAGAEVVGILFSAVSVGALLGALTTGWVQRVRRQGLAVLVAIAVWGAGITAFGLSGSNLALALGALAVAGSADVVSAVFRGTILQSSIPDALRGRMSAVHILVVTGGPRIGDVEAGLVAAAFTPTVSVVTGGLACIVGMGLLAALVPAFVRYRVDDDGRGVIDGTTAATVE
ncbi:MAG: MFS transporter [Acidimicrobiia bacterium]